MISNQQQLPAGAGEAHQHLPAGWVQPGPEGLLFGPLSVREADKLVLAIEDVAHGYRPRTPSVSPEQLTFDLGDL